MPETVHNLLQNGHMETILLTLMALTVLLLIALLLIAVRVSRLNRQITALLRGVDGQNLEQSLVAHMDTVDQTVRRMETLEQAVAVLQAQIPDCLQRVKLVRYDAFEDVGGEQSFSLAILDARGDGVVISSVYSRMDVRVYSKEIRAGRASHPLSQEEEHALKTVMH